MGANRLEARIHARGLIIDTGEGELERLARLGATASFEKNFAAELH